eukprot:TRINITY_DN102844_c0_g1_i1.p1 TRINITY_DN102844_c0_g1~~TRINITY_DN102844_c0_g1_i1.p1  ORF type:complete len:487 (-),score=118.65 TRINITY_DN102844_c0_g1_i1:111-1571(-)
MYCPTSGSFLPAIGKKDQHQLHSAIPQIHLSNDDPAQRSRHSKWYSRQKEIETELQRELDLIEQAEVALSQLGARKTQPASFGHPRPVPRPRFVKSRLTPILQPTEAAVRPRWGLSEDLLEEQGESPDVNAGSPLSSASKQEAEVQLHAPEEPWQAKARELEHIASESRKQHEQEEQQRKAAVAQDVGQQQDVPKYVDDERARQKKQLEERVQEIRQREEQRLEEIKQEELRRAQQELDDAKRRRQEQEEWEKQLRDRIQEEAEKLRIEREKDNLLLQQRAEAMQKQWEEREQRRKQQEERQDQQRQQQRAERQRTRAKAERAFRMDASNPMPEHAAGFSPKTSFSPRPAPPKMPAPPGSGRPSNSWRPQQPRPRPSPRDPTLPGAAQSGRTARSPSNCASTPKFTSLGASSGAAASGSRADLQAAKAAAMRDMLSLKKHPGFEARQKGYKELLRAWHPDKNPKNATVATAVFQMLQMEKGRILDS